MKTNVQAAKQKSWPYCGDRVKKWKQKNGVGVFTLVSANAAEAIKREALRHKKPQWKLLRACIEYGLPVAIDEVFRPVHRNL
jgi:hypothetical protein